MIVRYTPNIISRFSQQQQRNFNNLRTLSPYNCCSYTTSAGTLSLNKIPKVRLYRVLQRKCVELERIIGPTLLVHPPMDSPTDESSPCIIRNITRDNPEPILHLFAKWCNFEYDDVQDWVYEMYPHDIYEEEGVFSMWTTVTNIREAIREAFRESEQTDYLTSAFRAYRWLHQLEVMHRTSSVSTHPYVRIVATSRYVGRTVSSDNETTYRFAYRMRIENTCTDQTIQLLGRTWHIHETVDGKSDCGESQVHAPKMGAVGRLPVIRPGRAFEYMSGCELTTTTGYMKGSFHLCIVPKDTPHAVTGQDIEAFSSDKQFEGVVEPFLLLADNNSPDSS